MKKYILKEKYVPYDGDSFPASAVKNPDCVETSGDVAKAAAACRTDIERLIRKKEKSSRGSGSETTSGHGLSKLELAMRGSPSDIWRAPDNPLHLPEFHGIFDALARLNEVHDELDVDNEVAFGVALIYEGFSKEYEGHSLGSKPNIEGRWRALEQSRLPRFLYGLYLKALKGRLEDDDRRATGENYFQDAYRPPHRRHHRFNVLIDAINEAKQKRKRSGAQTKTTDSQDLEVKLELEAFKLLSTHRRAVRAVAKTENLGITEFWRRAAFAAMKDPTLLFSEDVEALEDEYIKLLGPSRHH